MRKVEMFECEDGKLFTKESEALIHEGLIVKVAEIVALFGKQPDGENWVVVPEANVVKADKLIKSLMKELNLDYDVTSRKAYDNDYMYPIANIKNSMVGNIRY